MDDATDSHILLAIHTRNDPDYLWDSTSRTIKAHVSSCTCGWIRAIPYQDGMQKWVPDSDVCQRAWIEHMEGLGVNSE